VLVETPIAIHHRATFFDAARAWIVNALGEWTATAKAAGSRPGGY